MTPPATGGFSLSGGILPVEREEGCFQKVVIRRRRAESRRRKVMIETDQDGKDRQRTLRHGFASQGKFFHERSNGIRLFVNSF
jgi:hypothetical protein